MNENNNIVKIMVLGDVGVGKSSIIGRYVGQKFSEEYKSTESLECHHREISHQDTHHQLQFWDVPGHERFGGMTSVFYKHSHGAIVTFDLSRFIRMNEYLRNNFLSEEKPSSVV